MSVDAATDALYSVFARYAAPQASNFSSHTTITEEDARALRSRPLRELSGRELGKYALKALTTWGDESELRHYLPRMLELVEQHPNWTDIPSLFGKLATGRWRSWPQDEQRAIEQYIAAVWASTLRGETHVSLPNLALGASNAGMAIAPLVDAWKNAAGTAPALQLADLVTLERNELLRDGSFGRRWSDEARVALDSLVHSKAAAKNLENAFFGLQDPLQTHTVSDALGVLEVLPRTAP